MPWKPSVEGEVPTLGWYVLDWMTAMLAAPARGEYEPFRPYREQEDFILRWYEIDPATGRFRYNRALLGRPRGWGKSPLLAALAAVEGLGDVLFDGWDADGQPVGRPWSSVRTPLVHIAAVSEEQTRNTWQPLLEMLRDGPVLDEYPGLEPMDSFVALPRGKIVQITSSARTVKGAPTTSAFLDQTEEWVPSNGGPVFAQNIRTNTSKNGGRTVESPNAYLPGEGSVAEMSAAFAQGIAEGRTRSKGLLYDHREAPSDTDMSDRESLLAGLRVAYGDSSAHEGGCVLHDPPCPPGHMDLEAQMERIWDPATDVQIARSDYLNQITHASDSWISQVEWRARHMDYLPDGEPPVEPVRPGDVITMGFDGSKGRARGKADATALVGCRVSDGHWFTIRVWEQPDHVRDWTAPADEVDSEVADAFKLYRVVGFLADPAGWTSNIAAWEAKFGHRLRVKASANAPITAWPRARDTRIVDWVERARVAIVAGEMTHDGSAPLTRHVLNARRRTVPTGYLLFKSYPDSPNKIDAAYAGVLAWKARLDAVAQGVGATREPRRSKVVVMSD